MIYDQPSWANATFTPTLSKTIYCMNEFFLAVEWNPSSKDEVPNENVFNLRVFPKN